MHFFKFFEVFLGPANALPREFLRRATMDLLVMGPIREDIDRPAADLVGSFRNIPTTVVADVAPGKTVMASDLKPVSSEMTTVGTALTVATPPADNLTVHKAVTLAEPGDVLVVDAKGYEEAAIWGELLSTSALAHEITGTIVDGAVRDAAEVGNLGYPLFARAVSPKPPTKAATGSINVPVACGNLAVDPGDIVIADAEGVAVLEPEIAREVREEATAKLDREATIANRVAEGDYLYDILALEDQFEDTPAGTEAEDSESGTGDD